MVTLCASRWAGARRLALVLVLALLAFPGPASPTAAALPGTTATLDTPEISSWGWGGNDAGQLSDGTPDHRDLPVPVRGSDGTGRLGAIVAIAGSSFQNKANRRSGFSLALDRDGRVWAWGAIGAIDSPSPQPVLAAAGIRFASVVAIAAGSDHALALDRDGRLWAWGNACGQLGTGAADRRFPAPVLVDGGGSPLGHIVAIAGGGCYSLALDEYGRVWTWGYRIGVRPTSQGQSSNPFPTLLRDDHGALLIGIVAIAAGGDHALVVDRHGRVWAWGNNDSGQLGDESRLSRPDPALVLDQTGTAPLTGIVSAAARNYASYALDTTGQVWAFGQLPQLVRDWTGVAPLNGIVAISARGWSVFAVDRSGQVWEIAPTPEGPQVARGPLRAVEGRGLLAEITAVAAGGDHTLALDRGGRVWAWGRNDLGQLGDNAPLYQTRPVLTRNAANLDSWGGVPLRWTAIVAGGSHSLALDSQGQVWAWGSNASGQLGRWQTYTATDPRYPYPVQLRGRSQLLSGVVAIAAGSDHSLALDRDGQVWAWGLDEFGQLGTGSGPIDDCGGEGPVPCQISPTQIAGLPPIAAIAAGIEHSLALDRTGRVWTWGGQAGRRSTPERVPILERIVAVAAGGEHSLALGADGAVWAWGSDAFGQIGDGARATERCGAGWIPPCVPTPVRVVGLPPIAAVAVGGSVSLALTGDGAVWSWGADIFGQLGDGPGAPQICRVSIANTATDYPCATSPVPVPGLAGVVVIAAGGAKNQGLYGGAYRTMPTADFALALDGAGHLWAWGDNTFGQLGDGSRIGRAQPVAVQDYAQAAPLGGVSAIAAGGEHALALRATDPATEACFKQTGYCLRGRFLTYWRDHGGLALNGYPLSDERREVLEDGKEYTVQYCERVRLEYHPENPAPYDVLLAQLGRQVVATVPGAPTAPVAPLPGARFFAPTGHNVARPAFVAFWDANGGLAQFGYPLTEEFVEDGRWVQYFERARFEYHLGYAATSGEVQLGQLGRWILGER